MLVNKEQIGKVRLLEQVTYQVMINIKASVDRDIGKQEAYSSPGVLLDTMYESFSMMAMLFNVTTATITTEQKKVLEVTLSYGTWLMAARQLGVDGIVNGDDDVAYMQKLLVAGEKIKTDGVSDANLAALYTQFGLTAP